MPNLGNVRALDGLARKIMLQVLVNVKMDFKEESLDYSGNLGKGI